MRQIEKQTRTDGENKMGVMPINRLLVTMALPIMISMIIQAMYNIVDQNQRTGADSSFAGIFGAESADWSGSGDRCGCEFPAVPVSGGAKPGRR